jgi:glycosyltransferase involved in cell wall biosynthesis
MIHIGLDMSRIGKERGGDETYSMHLAQALTDIDAQNTYHLYCLPSAVPPIAMRPNVQVHNVGPSSLWLRTPFTLPYAAWKDGLDVLHLFHAVPPICPARLIVTAYDLSYEIYPEYYPRILRWKLSTFVPYAVKRAQKVFTISEYSKNQLADLYRIPEEKIIVVHCGVDASRYHPIAYDEVWPRLLERYDGLVEDFILYVGSLQPRKNIPRLLKAYAQLISQENIPHQLVIVGKHKYLNEDVYTTLRRLRLTGRVLFTGHVPEEDIPLFFNAATVMIFPSLFEGFGLPPLEAMACGTSVVCAHVTSLPEVVGDAAVLVNPYSVEDIARGLHEVLSDVDLRAALAAKGIERARQFSWEAAARKALTAFEEIARC